MSQIRNNDLLENKEVNVKIKLALLWVALMFFYIYNDILSLYQPGHVADLAKGHLEGLEFTQPILFAGAVLMAIPSFMIILCITLKAKPNRIINITVGLFQILVLISTQFMGGDASWLYWRLYEFLEALLLLLVIWTAWKWPIDKRPE